MTQRRSVAPLVLAACLFAYATGLLAADRAAIDRLVAEQSIDVNAVRAQGPEVMPILVDLYNQTNDELKRAKIAELFYQLGWKSEAAKDAMLQDVHSDNRSLRLQVQWALGRVSSDDQIVDVLLDNMRDDKNPLFREKAACALASDQIHLTPKQRARLLGGLVNALGDPKIDVRSNAILALQIQTGQTKGFDPTAPEFMRKATMQEWQKWLNEYNANL